MNENLRNTLSDMVTDLLYYDRKEDDELPRGAIEGMIANGEVTQQDIIDVFAYEIYKGLK